MRWEGSHESNLLGWYSRGGARGLQPCISGPEPSQRWVLWREHYCPLHLVKKKHREFDFYCPVCVAEEIKRDKAREAKRKARADRVLASLKGEDHAGKDS